MKIKIPHIKLSKKKKILLILSSSFVLFAILSNVFLTLRTSDEKTKKYFQKANIECTVDYIPTTLRNYTVRSISTGNHTKNTILFIHGAPGAADAFYNYLKDSTLLLNARLISYDRPGYGYSGFGVPMTSAKEQAYIVKEIIDYYNLNNVLVIGHSYGGPIAAYASLLSSKINKVLLLAPAIDPDHEKYYWIGHFAQWKFTKWAVPTAFVVSADEKYAHAEDMRTLINDWQNVDVPVVSLQGDKDILVPYENLKFCENHFNPEYFTGKTIENENHFIPWTRKELVIEEILKLIQQ